MVYLHEHALLMVIFGIIAAVLLKVILLRFEDSLVLEGIGIAMTMYLIKELNYTANIEIVIIAVFIAFVFGYFAYRFKTADLSGLFSTALVGIILLVFADATWFLVMLAFFILGSVCTRYKFEYKKTDRRRAGKKRGAGVQECLCERDCRVCGSNPLWRVCPAGLYRDVCRVRSHSGCRYDGKRDRRDRRNSRT